MYITRRLSMFEEHTSNLSAPLPRAPNSGYAVIKGDEQDDHRCCWPITYSNSVKELPFPQNRILSISYRRDTRDDVLFIPVLNQPLSSNRYYVIRARGLYKGQACRCLTEDDIGSSLCFGNILQDDLQKHFDHRDLYQQVEICGNGQDGYYAKSIVPECFPPNFLRRKGWSLYFVSPCLFHYDDAQGLNDSIRKQLPQLNFSLPKTRSSPITIGKWICPFMFVREEGTSLRKQMDTSLFYNITMEQYWEEVYAKESEDCVEGNDNVVTVKTILEREVDFVDGVKVVKGMGKFEDDGFVWFGVSNKEKMVGLSSAIVERMEWVEKEGGWADGNGRERSVRVKRVEKNTSESGWKRFGCYVLVESFVFKRMDGSVVMNCDFRHTHKIKCKWE